jgi:hypothetical protein
LSEALLTPGPAYRRHRADDQETSDGTITHLGNTAQARFATARVLAWHQAELCGEVATRSKAADVRHSSQYGADSDRADAWDAKQSSGFRLFAAILPHLSLESIDPRIQGDELID